MRVDSLRTGLLFPPTDLYIIKCGSIRPDTPSLRPQADVSLSSAFLSPERGGAGARPSPPQPERQSIPQKMQPPDNGRYLQSGAAVAPSHEGGVIFRDRGMRRAKLRRTARRTDALISRRRRRKIRCSDGLDVPFQLLKCTMKVLLLQSWRLPVKFH